MHGLTPIFRRKHADTGDFCLLINFRARGRRAGAEGDFPPGQASRVSGAFEVAADHAGRRERAGVQLRRTLPSGTGIKKNAPTGGAFWVAGTAAKCQVRGRPPGPPKPPRAEVCMAEAVRCRTACAGDQRSSSGSLPSLSFHASASGRGALRLVRGFQPGSLASSAFKAIMCSWPGGRSSSA